MTNDPKISFIVCTRNRAPYAEACVKNLLNAKTDWTFEVIVRDNCSDDMTNHIFDGVKDRRLRYFRAARNEGWSTFLEGAKLARGELITWLSDEDDFHFENLAHVVDIFQRNRERNVLVGSLTVGPGKTPVIFPNFETTPSPILQSYHLAQQFSGCGGVVVRRDAFVEECSFSFIDQYDAYRRQNFYQIGYIAALCLQGRGLHSTQRLLVSEARNAPTTDNWSAPPRLATEQALQPHYYPRSIRDRLVSQISFVGNIDGLNWFQRLALTGLHIASFVRQIKAMGGPQNLELLRANYPEESVALFLDDIKELGLTHNSRKTLWVLVSLWQLPRRILTSRHLSKVGRSDELL